MPAGARRCYLNQDHLGLLDGLPFACHVGNCVADGDADGEAPIAIAYRGFDGAPQARSRPQVYGVLVRTCY